MGRGPGEYTDKQVTRRVDAWEKAGKSVRGVRYYRDHYELLFGEPGETDEANGLDRELAEFEKRHAD
jgi:hypothetical protein